jgi:putative SOS response-associated peptidase YedK
MPVMLPLEASDFWARFRQCGTAATLLAAPREGFSEVCEISTAVNRAANDRPALLEPIAQSPTPARVQTHMPGTAETQMSLPNA